MAPTGPSFPISPVSKYKERAMMMDALENVEKEIKKPLMRNDKKGMALLTE